MEAVEGAIESISKRRSRIKLEKRTSAGPLGARSMGPYAGPSRDGLTRSCTN